ncbi:MAG: DUF3520 domain-containing protein [Clostridiales bacterium]|nr:DUF3520 domain-containing protein [Clostridiales bacterium]
MKKHINKLLSAALALSFTLPLVACGANGGYGEWDNSGAPAPGGILMDGDFELGEPLLDYKYEEITENGFFNAATAPNSYFSLDRNTAAYSLMRKQINGGNLPSPTSVRLEEYINYFDYDYARPNEGEDISVGGNIFDCPWNEENKLMTVTVAAEEVDVSDVSHNIVLLVDTSGSMYGDDRLGLIQQSFKLLVEELDEKDTVSIVTYASGTSVALRGASGNEKAKIVNALFDLKASGSTNGAGGLQLAYEVAQDYMTEGSNNRVIIATDGDFNVGPSNKKDLEKLITTKRDSGIYLSVLGVGMYNTNDVTMKTLSENGNGNYAYLDTVAEAQKVLVKELGGTLKVVAKDAKIGVTFNADAVEKYRLIGYESKILSQEEFEDETKDTGEIGSGHNVTALYEVKLIGDAEGEVASTEIKYKKPDTDENMSVKYVLNAEDITATSNEDCVFIGCVTEFGLILRKSEYKANASLESVLTRLNDLICVKTDQFKAEFAELVKKAQKLVPASYYDED